MTMQPQMRFLCDRCKTEDVLPMSSGPASGRYDPPVGWVTLRLTADVSIPAGHLCLDCNTALTKFMEATDGRREGSGT